MNKIREVKNEIKNYIGEDYNIIELSNILKDITGDDIFNYDYESNIFDYNNISLNVDEDWINLDFEVVEYDEDEPTEAIIRIIDIY